MHTDPELDRVPRRRFSRKGPELVAVVADTRDHGDDVEAEIVLLREENARLKAAQHRPVDIGAVLAQVRGTARAAVDHDSAADEAQQLLVEGMLIRESLLDICRGVERSMVEFEARLTALAEKSEQRIRACDDPETGTHARSRLG